jgi:predicted lipid-binding transport protein (Tim44 family)
MTAPRETAPAEAPEPSGRGGLAGPLLKVALLGTVAGLASGRPSR